MNLYFDHCDNERFVSMLEERYFFGPNEFIHFTGNAGLIYWVNIFKQVLPSSMGNPLTPSAILLKAIDAGKLQAETMHLYMYSALMDLYNFATGFEGGGAQFDRIRQMVDSLRNQRMLEQARERKMLIVLADTSQCDIRTAIESLPDKKGFTYAAAFVPQKEELMTAERLKELEAHVPSGVEVIRLYDEKEHCVHFLRELSEEAYAMCYVDCLDQEYECGEMVGGYSLDVEHYCILKQEIYDRVAEQNDTVLQMMQSIYVY